MTWVELLISKGYTKLGKCVTCGGWVKWSNRKHLIRTKASGFAKLSINGDGKISNDRSAMLRLVKLNELEQYL